jgi:hypothetical protein
MWAAERGEDFSPFILDHHYKNKGKSKTIPLQALTGPEVSRRLRLQDFKTVGT